MWANNFESTNSTEFPPIKLVFSIDNLIALTRIFNEANNLQRWNDSVCMRSYNELNKQALNCIVAYFIAKYCVKAGMRIDFTKFPRIALGRISAKTSVYYDIPEHKIHEVCKIGGIEKSKLDEAARKKITELTSADFAEFVWEDATSTEVKIYRAATKVATLLEFNELKDNYESMRQKEEEIKNSIKEFWDVPGVKELSNTAGPEYLLLKEISGLRNSNRWPGRFNLIDCSVLGHLFDTACYGYLMSLLRGETEEEAAQLFWIGIFHDVAERWTKDIPSNVKAMIDGFRKATEEYERQMLKKAYSNIPEWLKDALELVSMEEARNERFKEPAKEADYTSADRECIANMIAGSRDPFWANIIKKERKFVTTEAEVLHERFAEYARKVLSTMPEL